MPELDLVKVMGRIWDLQQEDAKALGITSGKYVVSRGDPRGLDDKDVLKAVKPHVPKDTYKEIAAASKIGELQDEFGDWYADDSDDELYPVLEPIARRKSFVVSTLKCTFSVYGLSSVKTSFGDRNSSAFLGRLLSRFSARRILA